MKNYLILMASPRLKGNTAELCKPLINELETNGNKTTYITLHDKKILPCAGCYACQHVSGSFGCPLDDDVNGLMDAIIAADCIVLATPIYSWFCTAPMKALLDRHYGLNKFYGRAPRESLWAGKQVAIIATHGYGQSHACEPFEMAIQRLCKHSSLEYLGLYSCRDTDNIASFQTEEAIKGAREFARKLMAEG
ncbi:MAG: flavodoxin family protein [Defluviitaleaceae bacterium]|nr:flavodoxin family protein [Defluviitaleaceae bacterium]